MADTNQLLSEIAEAVNDYRHAGEKTTHAIERARKTTARTPVMAPLSMIALTTVIAMSLAIYSLTKENGRLVAAAAATETLHNSIENVSLKRPASQAPCFGYVTHVGEFVFCNGV